MRHKGRFIAMVTGVLFVPHALACTCALWDASTLLERVPVVFFAEVEDVGPETADIVYHEHRTTGSRVLIKSLESFKGDAPRELIQSGRDFACHPELKKGDKAIFLIYRPTEAIGLCNVLKGREDLLTQMRMRIRQAPSSEK